MLAGKLRGVVIVTALSVFVSACSGLGAQSTSHGVLGASVTPAAVGASDEELARLPSASVAIAPTPADDADVPGSVVEVSNVVPSGFPDALSTGPTDESLIPDTTTGIVRSSFDGEVLENFNATKVVITHDNVTVRNFRVTRDDRELWYAIALLPSAGEDVKGTVFEDGEIITLDSNGVPVPARGTGINGSYFEARRLEISYVENGFQCSNCVIEDNYIHDLIAYNGSHNDGYALTRGGNVTIRHNTILIPNQQTSAVILGTYAGPINNVLIEDNYLNGGSYTIYSRDNGNGYGPPTNVTITGNVFGRDYLFDILSIDGDVTWENNTWVDTGEPINKNGG